MKAKQIEYINVLKGLGIVLMITGHITSLAELNTLIYSFHMPLFFIISGYCFSQKTVKDYVIKKAKTLMIPYVIWFFTFVLGIEVILRDFNLKEIIQNFFFPNLSCNKFSVGALWFLPALFVSSILFNLMRTYVKNNVMFGIYCLTFMGIGFFTSAINVELPFKAAEAFVGIGFMYFGYAVRHYFPKLFKLNWLWIVGLGIGNFFIARANGKISMHSGIYNNVVLYIVTAILGTTVVWNIFQKTYYKIKNLKGIKFLLNVGTNSKWYLILSQKLTAIPFLILKALDPVLTKYPNQRIMLSIKSIVLLAFALILCYVISNCIVGLKSEYKKYKLSKISGQLAA